VVVGILDHIPAEEGLVGILDHILAGKVVVGILDHILGEQLVVGILDHTLVVEPGRAGLLLEYHHRHRPWLD
jgi:hypothetical protein